LLQLGTQQDPASHVSVPGQLVHVAPITPHAELDVPGLHVPPTPEQQPAQVMEHCPPHPSLPPHELPAGGQLGMQLHAYCELHVSVPGHVPQLPRFCPQPFGGVPHFAPSDAHVAGEHVLAHWKLPPQVAGAVQVPQLRKPPHPSAGAPHVAPSDAQVALVQPHVPDMQVLGDVQVPHWRLLPQPSTAVPQLLPCCAQVIGVHPHTFGVGAVPPPHV
jgi:hypothetical protein